MAWKCPECGELNSDNDIIICNCGYELGELDKPERIEHTHAVGAVRAIGILFMFAWQFIPAILIKISDNLAVILVLLGAVIIWSFLGLLWSVLPYIKTDRSPSAVAVLINAFGLVFWICYVIYAHSYGSM